MGNEAKPYELHIPRHLAFSAEMVCSVEVVTMEDLLLEGLRTVVEARKNTPDFEQKLRAIVDDARPEHHNQV
jgi:hypothetical protein